MRCRATVAVSTAPVSPMPPMVAQKIRSVSPCGVRVRTSPSAISRSNEHDMVAEAALGVVVLAVHVGGDRPADGHLAGARQHRDPQPEREQRPHQRVQAHPGLHRHRGRLAHRVYGEDAVHLRQVERGAARVLRGVAVAAAQAPRHDPTLGSRRCAEPRRRRRRSRSRPDGSWCPRSGPSHAARPAAAGSSAAPPAARARWRVRGRVAHQNTATEITTSQITPIPCRTRSCSTTSSGSPALPASTSSAYCSSPKVKGAIEMAVQGRRAGRARRLPRGGSRTPTGCRR